jgi:hypothetical protein
MASLLHGFLTQQEGLMPPEVEPHRDIGEPAFLVSSERMLAGFLEALQSEEPDGYLVGVGAGTLLALLSSFRKAESLQETALPLGMVIVEENPHVVAATMDLVETLTNNRTYPAFVKDFFHLSERQYARRIKGVIQRQNTMAEQARFLDRAQAFAATHTPMQVYATSMLPTPADSIDVVAAITEQFDVLRALAASGRIAVVHADFTTPALIEAISQLPDFKHRKHRIYASNIVQFLDSAHEMSALRGYSSQRQPALFLDATPATGLYLRVSRQVPIYSALDFIPHHFAGGAPSREELLFPEQKERW